MDTPMLISVVSLLVAFLALPTSYFVAARQVKLGIDAQERRTRQRARTLAADALEDFWRVFLAAVKEIAHAEPDQIRHDADRINPYLPEIDAFVLKTQVLSRLGTAIDNLLIADGLRESKEASKLTAHLQLIRSHIAWGSDGAHLATVGVVRVFNEIDLLAAIRSI